jgi:cell division cycle 14
LDTKVDHRRINKSRPVIFYSDADPKAVTNTVFLLCCYLVLRQGFSPEQAVERFESITGLPIIYFCDACPANIANKHPISVMDCLQGLTKAIRRGLWAEESFDVEAAEWLYNFDTFDLSIATPKMIAFSCPNTVLGGQLSYIRRPEKYVELFNRIGVTDIVRLNDDETYDPEEFQRAGFKWLDLSFPDCSCPSLGILERFLDLCDKAEGRVAIHCLAGLGRTGTLICCDLIKNHGFTALEAVGYLRLARPGSVIDVQHEFLRMVEDFEWDGNRPLVPDGWDSWKVDHHFQGPALVVGPVRSSRVAPV